jgi:hypothetical protein
MVALRCFLDFEIQGEPAAWEHFCYVSLCLQYGHVPVEGLGIHCQDGYLLTITVVHAPTCLL